MKDNQYLISLDQESNKKEQMFIKRTKAKEKTGNSQFIKLTTKQDQRKERNRYAAQKSRDKRKEYLQFLEQQNNKMKEVISKCSLCSDQMENISRHHQQHKEQIDMEQPQPFTQSPLISITNDYFLRQESDESSNLNKYFFFGCILVIICLSSINIQKQQDFSKRLLLWNKTEMLTPIKYQPQVEINKDHSHSNSSKLGGESAIMTVKQNNVCQSCQDCFRNLKNITNGSVSLAASNVNSNNSTSNKSMVIYCKSKAEFFEKMYSALNKTNSESGRQITKMLIKGRALKEMMKDDCFAGVQIHLQEQYMISFTLAIFQMTPVKMSRTSRLSNHND